MIKIQVKKNLLDINIEIKKHEFLAISGVSGSGKTTLLRVLAGLEEADGEINVFGETWLSSKNKFPIQKREIGFVFQDYALFENMSVEKNLLYVKKDKKLANHLLDITGLRELKNRMPNTLSGGQQQRVSLCRALMNRPKILLMDEPLSALDPQMRAKLQQDILTLHEEFKTTTLMVSHDPSEIYRLASRMITLSKGKIVEDSTPKELLLKTNGSQKFTLSGELLDIIKADVIFIAVVAIGQQIVEVVLDTNEAKYFKIGEMVTVSTKAFSPVLSKKGA